MADASEQLGGGALLQEDSSRNLGDSKGVPGVWSCGLHRAWASGQGTAELWAGSLL